METTKQKLPIIDMEAEMRAFEAEERKRLGLDGATDQWVEKMANLTFTKAERDKITILVGGLTMAHDYFVEAGLRGVGYNVQAIDAPDQEALQFGKEFGNRGQCNPTYFTVGNLVKILSNLRDKHGMTSQEIVKNYVFLTAGACGPCRFGMYVTEYRKALRDAGFDGFRVVLFQQTGGLKQATGEESGLELNPKFFWGIVQALLAGDVINAIGYRLRPYEVIKGDTDRALESAKKIIYSALEKNESALVALWKCKPLFASLKVDRTVAKPRVSIIGEFWAMTTEGDGNYHLQRFLESEGAEVDIQLVTAWLLYTCWEGKRDTIERQDLKAQDGGYYGLKGKGSFGATKKLLGVFVAEKAIRTLFQTFAHAGGLYGYKLANMDEIAEISHKYYNNDLRGGEGHMEVGKLIQNVVQAKAHMTLSVKPFGCMPSAGVSDGVQSAITEMFPGTIFCPVETSGDGKVNFYSRVQMYLFKAKIAAQAELDRAYTEHGITKEEFATFLKKSEKFGSALHKSPHAYAGTAADLVAEVAPVMKLTRLERFKQKLTAGAKTTAAFAQKTPHLVVETFEQSVKVAPELLSRAKEDFAAYREERTATKAAATAAANAVA
ncbi:MAG: 2-hydroxyglutaryl-CoA dehydratase [Polyangiaceae bacterium]|nr:2-hydroxyglutaryl-CoA dehydratase [Polyangiaceae bacterium]